MAFLQKNRVMSLLCILLTGSLGAVQANEYSTKSAMQSIFYIGVGVIAGSAAAAAGSYVYKKAFPVAPSTVRNESRLASITLKKGESYSCIELPKTIEDKQWTQLFGNQRHGKMDAQLEELIKNYLSTPRELRDPKGFLRAGMQVLAPYMKRFEVNTLPWTDDMFAWLKKTHLSNHINDTVIITLPFFKLLPAKSLAITLCQCCNLGRYHFSSVDAKGKNYHAPLLEDMSFHICTPNTKFLLDNLVDKAGCISHLWALGHEMGHIARLHSLAKHHSIGQEYNLGRIQELEADLVSFLVLGNLCKHEELFTSVLTYLFQAFIEQYRALTFERVLFQFLGSKSPLQYANFKTITKESSHPALPTRMKNILTIWAAYVAHSEPTHKDLAINRVVSNSRQLFKDQCDKLRTLHEKDADHLLKILDAMINEWQSENTDKEEYSIAHGLRNYLIY